MTNNEVTGPGYRLILGDCIETMKSMNDKSVDAIITDPPYGISLKTSYKKNKRAALADCNDFAPIFGDDKPFDPTPFLFAKSIVMFGANYYAAKLPVSGAWIVWDKLDGLKSGRDAGFNDNSDCELIWTNVGNATRIYRHRWMGAMKSSEQTSRRVHPTQKPVSLMRWIVRNYTRPGDTVFDPFMGSGSTGVACMMEGRRFIGIEISGDYFKIASKSIFDAAAQPRLIPDEPELPVVAQAKMFA